MHYDHIRLAHNGQRFRCEACGAEQVISLPITLARLQDQAAAFIAAHRDCPMRTAHHA